MATKTKSWTSGTGSVTIQYGGQGSGQMSISTSQNSLYKKRSMTLVVDTTNRSVRRNVTINQNAKPIEFTDGKLLNLDGSLSNNNYRAVSELIPVTPGDILSFSVLSGSQYPYIQWLYYNSNGKVKSSEYKGGDLLPGEQIMDSTTYYVRFMRYASNIYTTYGYAKVQPNIR